MAIVADIQVCVDDEKILSINVYKSKMTYQVKVNFDDLVKLIQSTKLEVHFLYKLSNYKYFGCKYKYNGKNIEDHLQKYYDGPTRDYIKELKEDKIKYEAVISAIGFLEEKKRFSCD